MRIIDEQHHQATAGSLARTLYPDTDGRAAGGADRRGRGGDLSRLLRGLVEQVATFWQRRAELEQLSRMSAASWLTSGWTGRRSTACSTPSSRGHGTPRAGWPVI